MINVVFVLLIGTGIVSGGFMEALIECKQQHHVSKEEAMTGESEEVKCFSECVLKKSGMMSDNNEFDEEKIQAEGARMIKNDEQKNREFEGAAKACIEKVNGENPSEKCAKGHALFKCMKEAMPMSKMRG
uniref:Odorant-binding protein 35 n=1 Tax=Apolygus lucorum TaxID=248454 RepID=A0A142FHA2_APOLU|nr:odorant-binding protein 35 [Apolygus lucorum]